MNGDKIIILAITAAVALVAGALAYHAGSDCEARGGVLVRDATGFWFSCVKGVDHD